MITSDTSHRHTIHRVHRAREDAHLHVGWDNAIAPILEVQPGDEVHVDVVDASGGLLHPGSGPEDLARLGPDVVNPVTGPIRVRGAAPGHTLVVEVLGFGAAHWGWTAIIPGFGLLADEFPDAALVTSHVRGAEVEFLGGLRVPLRPFAGTMGVAPAEPGRHSVIPPRTVGGNMDLRHLTAGATLFLPVAVPGALFSVGDSHAAQGDGEVCGTAVESPIDVTLRLSLSDRTVRAPEYRLPPGRPEPGAAGTHATTGVGPDLMQATREAVLRMIDYLGSVHGMAAADAYMLCSVAADLRIGEVVDAPNWVVAFHLPLSVFG